MMRMPDITITKEQDLCQEETVDSERLYWLFVDPLNGKYACTKTDPVALAVFLNEEVGKRKEATNYLLRCMVGHSCTWEEVQGIANSRYQGRYQVIT